MPAAAKVPCARPVRLVTGDRAELRQALARDGIALIACEARRRAAVAGVKPLASGELP